MVLKNRVGEKFTTKQGYEIEIVEYIDSKNIKVRFEKGHALVVRMHDIKRGFIMNPLHPMTYGVGYLGIGEYKTKVNNVSTPYYRLWNKVLERCYSERYQIKNPTYKNCTISEEWHNFQNFAKWYEENYIEGFELDKDILVKGNKIYSPETCCFIPPEINTLLIKCDGSRGIYPLGVYKVGHRFASCLKKQGKNVTLGTFDTPEEAFQVYKTAKEEYIKEVADIWKPLIQPKVYRALYNYKVEIND